MASDLVFFRYRHKFASHDGDWEYLRYFVTPETDLQASMDELGEELCEEYDYSDKYRGVDVEVMETPPWDLVLAEMEKCRAAIESNQQMWDALEKLLPPKEDI